MVGWAHFPPPAERVMVVASCRPWLRHSIDLVNQTQTKTIRKTEIRNESETLTNSMNAGLKGLTSSAPRGTLGEGAMFAAAVGAEGGDEPWNSEDPFFEDMAKVLDDSAGVVSCPVSCECPCARPCARPCVSIEVEVAEVIITPESFRSSCSDDDLDSGSPSRRASRMPCTRPE